LIPLYLKGITAGFYISTSSFISRDRRYRNRFSQLTFRALLRISSSSSESVVVSSTSFRSMSHRPWWLPTGRLSRSYDSTPFAGDISTSSFILSNRRYRSWLFSLHLVCCAACRLVVHHRNHEDLRAKSQRYIDDPGILLDA
jgi:hypothetical protein